MADYTGTHDFTSATVLGITGGGGSVATSGGIIAETYTALDLTATGIHQLYTVPAGVKASIYGAVFLCDTGTAITSDASVSVGSNASAYDDVIADQSLVQFRTTDKGWKIIDFGAFTQAQASSDIKLRVNTAASGTTLDAHVYLLGFLKG